MSESQKVALGTTLAGVNQYKVFAAVMNNFDTAIKATGEALNSNGATMRQNSVYMESLEAKTQALRTEFEKLVLGDGGLQKLAKLFVDLGTTLLKVANSDMVQIMIKIGLLIGAFTLLKKALDAIEGAKLTSNFKIIGTAIVALITKTGNATKAVEALTTAIMDNPLFWGTLAVGAIAGVIALVEKFNVTLDEQVEKLNESKQAYEEVQSQVETTQSSLDGIREKIDAINAKGLEVTDSDRKQLQILQEEESVLANQLTILQEQARVKQDEYTREAKKTLEKRFKDAGAFGTTDMDMGVVAVNEGTAVQALDAYNKKIQESQEKINGLLERKQALIDKGYAPESDAVNVVNGLIADEIATRDSARSSAVEYAQIVQEATQYANQEDEAIKQAKDTLDEYHETIGETKDSLEELAESDEDFINNLIEANELTEEQAEKLREQIQAWIEAGNEFDDFDFDGALEGITNVTEEVENAEDATKRLNQATQDLNNSLSNLGNMASSYDTLTKAVEEYNSTGQFSIQTLSSLASLGTEWLGVLDEQNGTMSINEEKLRSLANSYIDDAEAKAIDKAEAELLAASQRNVNTTMTSGVGAANSGGTAIANAGNKAQEAGNKADVARVKFANLFKTLDKTYSGKVDTSTYNNIVSGLKKELNTLESYRKSINTNTTATIKNTGATKSNTKASGGSSKAKADNTKATSSNTSAVDENTKALKANVDALKAQRDATQKEVDDYEKVINYLNKKVDEEIKKLEKARDAEVDAIKAQIDYYEDLADKEDEELKNRIDNLEKAKDAEKDYWDNRIKELKDANDALEDQLELEKLLQNLESAKRKKVKVYKEGQGFVYDSDTEAISKAQRELDEYYRKKALDDQIKGMEKQREEALALYDRQINDLENYRNQQKLLYGGIVDDLKAQADKIKANYEVQIKYFEDWKEKFAQQTSAYENEVLRQLTIQKTGIDTEAKNWTTRLGNLDNFVNNYNAKLKELGDLEAQLKNAEDAYNRAVQAAQSYVVPSLPDEPSGGGGYGGGGGGTTTPSVPTANYKVALYVSHAYDTQSEAAGYITGNISAPDRGKYQTVKGNNGKYYVVKTDSIKAYQGITESQASNKAGALAQSNTPHTAIFWKYASGVASVGSNQMALVGDDPNNRELVIGSKLNGTATSLQKGSGVVNAESTKTLAGLINCLGKFGSSNFGNGNGVLNSNTTNSQDLYIDKVVIEGSKITDVVSFKNSLMNLKSEATQRAYKHKQ